MVSYTERAVRGTVIVFITSVLVGILGYLVRILFARNLTIEEFGLFYAALTIIGLIGILRDAGLNQALVKHIPEFLIRKRQDLIKSAIIITGISQIAASIIIALFFILTSDFLATHYFHHSIAKMVIAILAIGLITVALNDIWRYIFQGFQKMYYFSINDIVKPLLILAISFICFKSGLGVLSSALAYAGYGIISFIIFYPIFVKKVFPQFHKIEYVFDRALMKKLLGFGLPIVFGAAGTIILGYTDTIILTYFSGLKQVGLYNVALPTAKIPTCFSLAIAAVFFPMISELWAKKDKKRLSYGIKNVYKYLIILVIPTAFIIISFPKVILRLLFGEAYIGASLILQILSTGIILFSIAILNFQIIQALGKPRITTRIVYIAALFNLVFNFILIPKYGVLGAAATTFISYNIMLVLSLLWIKRFIKVRFPLIEWAKIVAAGLIFIFIIYYLKKVLVLNLWVEAIVSITIAGIVYILLILATKVETIRGIKGLLGT